MELVNTENKGRFFDVLRGIMHIICINRSFESKVITAEIKRVVKECWILKA